MIQHVEWGRCMIPLVDNKSSTPKSCERPRNATGPRLSHGASNHGYGKELLLIADQLRDTFWFHSAHGKKGAPAGNRGNKTAEGAVVQLSRGLKGEGRSGWPSNGISLTRRRPNGLQGYSSGSSALPWCRRLSLPTDGCCKNGEVLRH